MTIHHQNELSIPRRLESWVAEYEAKLAGIPAALEAFEAAKTAVKAAACVSGVWGEETIDTGRGISTETMARSICRSAWRKFIAELRLYEVVSASDKRRVEQMLADPLPFDVDSIRAVFGEHIANPRAAILRGLAEVFAGLDPAYRSHEKMKIGVKGLPKRVVIYGFGGFIGTRYHSGGRDRVRDILNALAAYQRKPLVSNAELHALEEDGDALRESREFLDPSETSREHRRRAERGEPPKTIRTVGRGVWLKTFRNGNGHLFFGPEALRDINMALAEYYGDVLPDCPDAEAERPAPRAGSTAVAKDLQFYPTPRPVIDRILRDWNMTGLRVLEPSCGDGRIMDALRDKGALGFGVEVDPFRAGLTRAKGHSCLTANFLEVMPDGLPPFDAVVMNPPFYGRHYVKHLTHAARFLKPGGRLVSILPVTARDDHGELGPEWLKANGMKVEDWQRRGGFYDLPVGSFSESGTNINTVVFTAFKVQA